MSSDDSSTEDVRDPGDNSELDNAQRYGARVFQFNNGVVLVKQTVKSGPEQTAPYVIDGHRERHVDPGNDAVLGAAVREALHGNL